MQPASVYYRRGIVAFGLFLLIGLVVWFMLQPLTALDHLLQSALRGNLPENATHFFRIVTQIANPPIIIFWSSLLIVWFYFFKQWQREAELLLVSLVIAGILSLVVKPLFMRPRPSISHLVEATGFSFPSNHSLATTLVIGTLILIIQRQFKTGRIQQTLQWLLASLILIVLLSRVYLGVHYPSDVIAGYLLGFSCLQFITPWYYRTKQTLR